MSDGGVPHTPLSVESRIGLLLRVGVALSASIVLLGAVVYLWRHGGALPDYRTFHAEPRRLGDVSNVVTGVMALRGRSIIELGLLVLIVTPVVRVAFAAYGFCREHDGLYVMFSLVVLSILLFSLIVMR